MEPDEVDSRPDDDDPDETYQENSHCLEERDHPEDPEEDLDDEDYYDRLLHVTSYFYGTPTEYPPDPDDPIRGISQWLHEHKILHHCFPDSDPRHQADPNAQWTIAIPCNRMGDHGYYLDILQDDRGREVMRLLCTSNTARHYPGIDVDDSSVPWKRNGVTLLLAEPDFFAQLELVAEEFGLRQKSEGEMIRERIKKLTGR